MEKKRILIVDDEVAAARLLKAHLEPTGRYEARVEILPEDPVSVVRGSKPERMLT